MSIRTNAQAVLGLLQNTERGRGLSGPHLSQALSLSPQDVNDAVGLLEDQAKAETHCTLGTAPYSFSVVWVTLAGRMEQDGAAIQEAAARMLQYLEQREATRGDALAQALGLEPRRVNEAVALLESNGLVETLKTLGTAPFDFARVAITRSGKLWLEDRR